MSARHRWVRVKVHVYICETCGCGKVNAEPQPSNWETRYFAPNGKSQTRWTPPCEVGPLTAAYLKKYESAIAVGGLPKEQADAAF